MQLTIISYIPFPVVCFISIVLQTTLLSSKSLGGFQPDLNLVLAVFIGLFIGGGVGFIYALWNGFLMDVFSGYMLGAFSLSRLSLFFVLRSLSDYMYVKGKVAQGISIYAGTLFSLGFTWLALEMTTAYQASSVDFSLMHLTIQAFINTILGIPIFGVFEKVYARVQE